MRPSAWTTFSNDKTGKGNRTSYLTIAGFKPEKYDGCQILLIQRKRIENRSLKLCSQNHQSDDYDGAKRHLIDGGRGRDHGRGHGPGHDHGPGLAWKWGSEKRWNHNDHVGIISRVMAGF